MLYNFFCTISILAGQRASLFWHLWHNGFFVHWMLLEKHSFTMVSMASIHKKTQRGSTKTHRLILLLGCLDRCGKGPCHTREPYYFLEDNKLLPCPLPSTVQHYITPLFRSHINVTSWPSLCTCIHHRDGWLRLKLKPVYYMRCRTSVLIFDYSEG